MGTKAQRLTARLARVYIPPYVRVKDGARQNVDGYWREVSGGQLAGALQEQAKKAGVPDAKTPAQGELKGMPKAPRAPKDVTPEAPKTPDVTPGKGSTPKSDQLYMDLNDVDLDPDPGDGSSANNPIVTEDIDEAVKALSADKYVRLKTTRQVSTLVDKLAELVDAAKTKGDKAPNIDLCKVSVSGTNLFCHESVTDPQTGKKIPRIEMPQLGGIPVPGSKADAFPKNKGGEVDLSQEFARYLTGRGTKVTDERVGAGMLKASQNELGGPQVAIIARSMEQKGIDPDRAWLWTSNDDYVIDGHHRWAAMVSVGLKNNNEVIIPVHKVDMDIISILKLAKEWTKEMGIQPAKKGGAVVELSAVDHLRVLLSDCGCS